MIFVYNNEDQGGLPAPTSLRRSKPLQKIQVRLGTWQALIATEKGIGNFGRQPRAAISRKRLKKKPFRKHVIGDVGQQLRS